MARHALLLALALPAMAGQSAPPPSSAPDATAPAPKAPAKAASGHFLFPDRPVYAGEVLDLGLVWTVDWDLFRNLDGDTAWTADPLVAESWQAPQQEKTLSAGGRALATVTLKTRAIALQPGKIALKPASQRMIIVTGGYETDGVKIATLGPVTAESAKATLTVRPLPPPLPGFAGAVGHFTLASTIGKPKHTAKTPTVGVPITWTLSVSGTGNWPVFGGVPERQLSRDFDLIGTPKQEEVKGSTLFDRTMRESITIVPRKPGHFELGPVDMIAFDPAAGHYVTFTAPSIGLDIKPADAPAQAPTYEAEPDKAGTEPPLPARITGAGHAWAPLPARWWRMALILPPLACLGLWLTLALLHARKTDPAREARRAHRRLATILATLAQDPPDAERRLLVRAWQRDIGTRLKLAQAAPLADSFPEPDWSRLWSESETYLYGRTANLPPDWTMRAQALLAANGEPPKFQALSMFAPRHLYPITASLCLVLLAIGTPLSAAGENDLRHRVAATPMDWIAHYDLALDAAAGRRWSEAAAEAGIAWVQHPRSAETRALWRRAAQEAGYGGLPDGGIPLPDGTRGRLSALFSPFLWQLATLLALLGTSVGVVLALLDRFGWIGSRMRVPALALLSIGAVGTLTGLAGFDGYGAAGYPDAAIVWRQVPLRELPVDTPDDEAPVTLGPGNAGRMGRRFMGWIHFQLRDGRSGWLRREELKPLWRARP